MIDTTGKTCKYKYQDETGYKFNGKPYCTCFNELCEDVEFVCDENCQIYEDYKKLLFALETLKEIRQGDWSEDCNNDCEVAIKEIEGV